MQTHSPIPSWRRPARVLCLTPFVALVFGASTLLAVLPEPDAVLFGFGSDPLPPGTLVEARVGSEVVASYLVGSIPAAGSTYLLRVPVETPIEVGEPRTPGVARAGDLLQVFLNGVDTGEAIALGERGLVARLDVEVVGDISAPTPPLVSSSSHTPGEWTNLETVDLVWSGASDSEGVAGYSVGHDRVASTMPDGVVDVLHASDPHQWTIGPLAEADDHYFHLRACDVSSNCSGAVHVGPFRIDATPPGAPGDVGAGGPDPSDRTIDLVWIAATDDLSGVEGYGVDFSRDPDAACEEGVDTTGITATSDPLDDGDWYAVVCAVDRAGNWGASRTAGPFSIEALPPTVSHVGSVAATSDTGIDPGDAVRVPVTQLLLTFSEPMRDPVGDGGEDDVTNPANYLLLEEGDQAGFQTTDCSAGAAAQDVAVPISTVTYEDGELVAALRVGGDAALPAGRYRLGACATDALRDLAGKALDGNGDETGGDDFWIDFSISRDHLLENPNFDSGTEPWVFVGSSNAGQFWSSTDRDGAATSGSGEITGASSGSDFWSIGQCLPVQTSTPYRLVVSAEIDSGAAEPSAHAAVEFFPYPECRGVPLAPAALTDGVFGDTAGIFVELATDPAPSAEASSARVSLLVSTESSVGFEVRFDAVSLSTDTGIFSDGFETGDLSGWSGGSSR